MSSECVVNVVVKLEPEADTLHPPEDNIPSNVSTDPTEPEFIDIKMEIDVEIPQASIKNELPDGNYPTTVLTPEPHAVYHSWHHPVSAAPTEPEVNVKVKSEPVDYPEVKYLEGIGLSLYEPTSSSFSNVSDEDLNQYSVKDGKFVCPICNKRFANNGNVQRHMILHSRVKYQCEACNKQFLKSEQLEKHISHKHASDPRNFDCQECGKKFKTSSNLFQHKRVHMTEKPFFCEICHRSFAVKSNLLKHQGKSRCKRPIDEPLVCPVCNKEFQKQFLLKSHLRRHTTERPYSCDLCGMDFKYKSTIIRHIQWHNGYRPYKCKYCQKSFTHSGLLKPHLRVHTGEKPFQCSICAKYFAHKHNMLRHKLRHNKIKRLVCDICNKKFPRESRLIYHMRTHTNEKHFSCHVCPKQFSHKQNVLRHYSRKHPGETYTGTDTDASVALKVWDKVQSKLNYESDEPEEILG